jgi:hypothetical protein
LVPFEKQLSKYIGVAAQLATTIAMPIQREQLEIIGARSAAIVADKAATSRLYRFQLRAGHWSEAGQLAARSDVFQVGPLLSPDADRVLFAQAAEELSGKMLLVDLVPTPNTRWPRVCD